MQMKTMTCYFLIFHIGKYFKSSTNLVLMRWEMGVVTEESMIW